MYIYIHTELYALKNTHFLKSKLTILSSLQTKEGAAGAVSGLRASGHAGPVFSQSTSFILQDLAPSLTDASESVRGSPRAPWGSVIPGKGSRNPAELLHSRLCSLQ